MTSPRGPAIADSMLELVGATPMVRLRRLVPHTAAEVVVKLESLNPAGSVKDRVALRMLERAAEAGKVQPGDTIVEPTSGNTGIGLALVAAVKGYRLIIVMPDNASEQRRRLLEHYGAKVVLTPAKKLMQGAIDRAREIVAENPRCFMPAQFDNPANPEAHHDTTAQELLTATEGRIDAFVVGVGTGGTITGVGQVLRKAVKGIRIIAVEPERSRALSGGPIRTHGVEGLGAGFVPSILDRTLIDQCMSCSERQAFETSRQLARQEGISAGISGGAAVWAAIEVASRLGAGHRVVTVIPDGWDRYASEPRAGDPRSDFII